MAILISKVTIWLHDNYKKYFNILSHIKNSTVISHSRLSFKAHTLMLFMIIWDTGSRANVTSVIMPCQVGSMVGSVKCELWSQPIAPHLDHILHLDVILIVTQVWAAQLFFTECSKGFLMKDDYWKDHILTFRGPRVLVDQGIQIRKWEAKH